MCVSIPATPTVTTAQAPATVWERSIELSGNYLYGNTDQAILSARTSLVKNDSSVSLRLDTRFLIGVTDRQGEGRVVDRYLTSSVSALSYSISK